MPSTSKIWIKHPFRLYFKPLTPYFGLSNVSSRKAPQKNRMFHSENDENRIRYQVVKDVLKFCAFDFSTNTGNVIYSLDRLDQVVTFGEYILSSILFITNLSWTCRFYD